MKTKKKRKEKKKKEKKYIKTFSLSLDLPALNQGYFKARKKKIRKKSCTLLEIGNTSW